MKNYRIHLTYIAALLLTVVISYFYIKSETGKLNAQVMDLSEQAERAQSEAERQTEVAMQHAVAADRERNRATEVLKEAERLRQELEACKSRKR